MYLRPADEVLASKHVSIWDYILKYFRTHFENL
jgi:hypothetical protein